jgi:hypothetical protein
MGYRHANFNELLAGFFLGLDFAINPDHGIVNALTQR